MNEQEKQLLEKYLQYIRKKRIIVIVFILVIIVASSFLFKISFNNNSSIDEPVIQENQNFINDVVMDNNISNSISNTTTNDTKEEPTKAETSETKPEIKPENSTISQEKVGEDVKPSKVTTERKEAETTKNKPANKDFLFKDGYTMDNVTSVAQDYLKSNGSSGKCIPLKDKDGVYIGMRVIFY